MKTIHDPRYISMIERLRQARLDAGLSQAQAAKAMGWCRSVISDVETRERRLDLLETILLCRLYGVSLDALAEPLHRAGNPHRTPAPPKDGKGVRPIE
jgi:transcriptional regulator with XRE-family HTH domain